MWIEGGGDATGTRAGGGRCARLAGLCVCALFPPWFRLLLVVAWRVPPLFVWPVWIFALRCSCARSRGGLCGSSVARPRLPFPSFFFFLYFMSCGVAAPLFFSCSMCACVEGCALAVEDRRRRFAGQGQKAADNRSNNDDNTGREKRGNPTCWRRPRVRLRRFFVCAFSFLLLFPLAFSALCQRQRWRRRWRSVIGGARRFSRSREHALDGALDEHASLQQPGTLICIFFY